MSHQPDVEALRSLATDQRFKELEGHVSSLALIRAFGAARDEIAHSRLLATLFDPQRHTAADAMLRVFLREVASQRRLERNIGERLQVIAEAQWERVTVRREGFAKVIASLKKFEVRTREVLVEAMGMLNAVTVQAKALFSSATEGLLLSLSCLGLC